MKGRAVICLDSSAAWAAERLVDVGIAEVVGVEAGEDDGEDDNESEDEGEGEDEGEDDNESEDEGEGEDDDEGEDERKMMMWKRNCERRKEFVYFGEDWKDTNYNQYETNTGNRAGGAAGGGTWQNNGGIRDRECGDWDRNILRRKM